MNNPYNDSVWDGPVPPAIWILLVALLAFVIGVFVVVVTQKVDSVQAAQIVVDFLTWFPK